MAKYGAFKYAEEKYGNSSFITETDEDFRTAQAATARKLYSTLKIISHLAQYGRKVQYPATCFVGGDNHRRLSQKFVSPKSFTCKSVKIMLKGDPDNTGNLIVEIQGDDSGVPDGSAIANASVNDVSPIISSTPRWYKVEFNGDVSLVAGTLYHLVIREDGTTSDITYIAADDKTAGDQAGMMTYQDAIYGTFKYGSGIKYGSHWADDWEETDYIMLSRLISASDSENEQTIQEAVGWDLARDRDVPCYQFAASIVNEGYKYSIGQIYSDWLEAGNKVKCYLGFEVSGAPVQYLVFVGETDESSAGGDIVQLEARCLMKRLIDFSQAWEDLAGADYEDIIQSVAGEAGITSFDLRATGKAAADPLSLSGLSAYEVAEKCREATIDRMQFLNTEALTTAARASASISEATSPKYELADTDFIMSADIGTTKEKMINRITITNDENGETSSDGEPLAVGDFQTLGTDSGSLLATEKTKTINIPLSETPAVYITARDAESDCIIQSISIDCGTSAVAGSVDIVLRNKNYPDGAGDYDLSVLGCPILNADTGTHIGEAIDWQSWQAYGKMTARIDNRIIGSKADAEAFAAAVISEKRYPTIKAIAECRGIVDIYPDDVVRLTTARKTKLDHLAIITLCQLRYQKDPASFTMTLAGEKTDFKGS